MPLEHTDPVVPVGTEHILAHQVSAIALTRAFQVCGVAWLHNSHNSQIKKVKQM